MKTYTSKQEIENDTLDYILGPITFSTEQMVKQAVYAPREQQQQEEAEPKLLGVYEWSLLDKLRSVSLEE